MKHTRDLMDIENVGEFAFAMCMMGVLLAGVAFAAAFFLGYWLGFDKRSHLIVLTTAIWVALNVPVYRSLKRKAGQWGGERRATKQVTYVEICSVVLLAGLSLLAGDTTGSRELLMFFRYLFSFWILLLIGYEVLIHLGLRYKISTRDAVRWCLIGGFAIYSLYTKSA